MREGFANKESTLTCFVDLEKAYDSVWREGLMVKLSKLGVKGRMWSWIFSFLSDRRGTCKIGDFSGGEFASCTGLPQGSVISPLLFNIFIMDMFEEVTGEHTKFADDGTLWHTGNDVADLAIKVSEDVEKILLSCNKWRMKLSLSKTEVTVFHTKDTCDRLDKEGLCKVNGKELQYNPCPKILGITLDEQLNFQEHVTRTERKASRALHILREMKGIARISSKKLIELYFTLIRSVMEYGCSIWQTVARPDLRKLENIQRKALALCLDLPGTASREAMEVAAGVVPLDLRFCEIAIRDIAKIAAKRQDDPLKTLLNKYTEEESWDSVVTPVGLAMSQVIEMKTVTGTGIEFVEPEAEFAENAFVRSLEKPSYWTQLGSSKNRTSEQQQEGKAVIQNMVNEVSAKALVCFTDGSCLTNPGPCGAGAAIYHPEGQIDTIKRPVAAYGSILLGELVAILSVLEHLLGNDRQVHQKEIRIFSDSQTAVGILTLNWASNHYQDVIKKIKQGMSILESRGWRIDIVWTPGHSDVEGNDVADRLAKEAAMEAKELEVETSVVTVQDIKKHARDSIKIKWQQRWDIAEFGRDFYLCKPFLKSKIRLDIPNTRHYKQILQLRTGYSLLNDYRHKLGQCDSGLCECGQMETVQHYLLECHLYEEERAVLFNGLREQLGLHTPNIYTLLGYDDHEEIGNWRELILEEVGQYIDRTERFRKSQSHKLASQ